MTLVYSPDRERRLRLVLRVVLALGVMLALLGISEPSLTLAGGIILFLISLRMIFPRLALGFDEEIEGEPFIVPLAIPFVAGPSAMASVLFIMNREPERWPEWLLALVLAWLATGLVLVGATSVQRFLGRRGLVAMERLMGMLLATLSVQMFMQGVADFLER